MLKSIVLFVALTWNGNSFVPHKENNSNKAQIKKHCQMGIIFESNRKLANVKRYHTLQI